MLVFYRQASMKQLLKLASKAADFVLHSETQHGPVTGIRQSKCWRNLEHRIADLP